MALNHLHLFEMEAVEFGRAGCPPEMYPTPTQMYPTFTL